MTDNVPRNIERRVESMANVRSLDVKDIRVDEDDDDAIFYRVVIDDPDAEEGENPSFVAVDPKETTGLDMFGQRLESGLNAVRDRLLGRDPEDDADLQETRQKLEESGHPSATGEEVEYGPGPEPNVEGVLNGGYDDGDIRVQSTTDADFPEPSKSGGNDTTEAPATQEKGELPTNDTEDTTMEQETQIDGRSIPDDFWGDIADAALDARELEEKGHGRAADALLEDIREDIEGRLGDDDE